MVLFFLWCLFIFIAVYFYYYFLFYCLIAFCSNKSNFLFTHKYVPLVIKAKRIAVGLFQRNLAEDDTMFVLLYFCT